MRVSIHSTHDAANDAAAALLANWLRIPEVRTLMVAAGQTPLELYRRLASLGLPVAHLKVFALDEYVGVPPTESRNCANLLRRSVAEVWGLRPESFFGVSPLESEALTSVREHEQRIQNAGGLDIVVLGLGQNGHLGFNEPGSLEDSTGRVVDLDPISIEANRRWFGGDFAPSRGVTVGLSTILGARRVLLMAYGSHKLVAVRAMVDGPRTTNCPASLLQGHGEVHVFLDTSAASGLETRPSVP